MNVLSIAGFDPSGGAGVLADAATFSAMGVDGCGVVTAITAQHARAVDRVEPVAPELVRAQLDTLLAGTSIAAAKIGMLGTAAIARVVAGVIGREGLPNVVIDPVIRASAGARLLDDEGIDVLRGELFAHAALITPNAAEAGALLDRPAPRTVRDMHDVASALHELGPACVLVTGGHVDAGAECIDVLWTPHGTHELRTPRIASAELHGTGCRLSSAIAARLALGSTVIEACTIAQRYVAAAIAAERTPELVP